MLMRTVGCRRGLVAGVVLGSLLLTGCGSTATTVDKPAAKQSSGGTPSPTRDPNAPLDLAGYQKKLTQLDSRLAKAYQAMVAAPDKSTLARAYTDLARYLRVESEVLATQKPPADVAAAHNALRKALTDQIAAMRSGIGDASPNCAGVPLVVQDLQRGMETRLRPALNQLAKLGLKAGTFLPKKLPAAPVLKRPANGTTIVRTGSRGSGRLRVDNGLSTDVAISVVSGGKPSAPQVMTYVQAGKQATINGIRGGYQVYFKSGSAWNGKTRQFTKSCKFQKFDQPFSANTGWQISLKPSIGGNASSSEVDAY